MTHLSAWTHHPEERGAIRLLALWLLLEGAEQAISKGSRISENRVQAEGGQPSGWPPAPAPGPETGGSKNRRLGSHRELHALLKKEIDDSATPQETRRVAEILEFLDRDDEARSWWNRAALKGDQDALDYLHVLDAENDGDSSSYCWREKSKGDQSFRSFVRSFACSPLLIADRLDSALGEAGVRMPDGSQNLVREIEDFLTHLDHTTGGPRC
ncbi:hypothetical protein [Streptomyces sp. NPDC003327]